MLVTGGCVLATKSRSETTVPLAVGRAAALGLPPPMLKRGILLRTRSASNVLQLMACPSLPEPMQQHSNMWISRLEISTSTWLSMKPLKKELKNKHFGFRHGPSPVKTGTFPIDNVTRCTNDAPHKDPVQSRINEALQPLVHLDHHEPYSPYSREHPLWVWGESITVRLLLDDMH